MDSRNLILNDGARVYYDGSPTALVLVAKSPLKYLGSVM
jgi:hypothetical protein